MHDFPERKYPETQPVQCLLFELLQVTQFVGQAMQRPELEAKTKPLEQETQDPEEQSLQPALHSLAFPSTKRTPIFEFELTVKVAGETT